MRKYRAIAALIATLGFTLFYSYEIKRPCLEKPWGAPQMLEYRNLCYNDVQALYGVRKLDQRAFPYIEEKSYEYPVLMGMTMWATSYFAKNHVEYFNATVPLLVLMACLSLAGLVGALGARRELLWFSMGTPVLFYAYLNWDLLPVMFVCLAMWAWSRRWIAASGAAIGLGVAAKIYPGFLLPSLAIALWREGEDRKARARGLLLLLGGALGAWVAVNLPILLAEYIKTGAISGWAGFFSFHAKRSADFGTAWYWIYRFSMDDFPAYFGLLPSFLACATAFWMAMRKGSDQRRITVAAAFAVLGLVLLLVMHSIREGDSIDDFRGVVDHASEFLFGSGAIVVWLAQWKRGHHPWVSGAAATWQPS